MSDLLPSKHDEFALKDYWDTFFQKRGSEAFEWYGDYNQLSTVLHQYVRTQDSILMVGCGNSTLSSDLYGLNFTNITNIDISSVVIKQMTQLYKDKCPSMTFAVEDVTKMSYENESFSAVIDKGTLDALCTDSESGTVERVTSMFDDVMRTMKPLGKYITISLAQEHVLQMFVDFFSQKCVIVRAHTVPQSPESDFVLPVFALVVTKLRQMPGMKAVFELAAGDGTPHRCKTPQEFLSSIKEIQNTAIFQRRLAQGPITDNPVLTLYSLKDSSARYTLKIADKPMHSKETKFGIFVVPLGRDVEWEYNTKEGFRVLLEMTGFDRLVIVVLDRSQVYDDVTQIEDELSDKIINLAPASWKSKSKKVPMMSCCNDIIGEIKLLEEKKMEIDGTSVTYTVEEVVVSDVVVRQLIVRKDSTMDDEQQVEYERCNLQMVSTKKSSYMSLDYKIIRPPFTAVFKVISFVNRPIVKSATSILFLGLRSGVLVKYLTTVFKKMKIKVVESDAALAKLAQTWFDCGSTKQVSVYNEGWETYIQNLTKTASDVKFDAIFLNSPFLSSPTSACDELLKGSLLPLVKKILSETGILICSLYNFNKVAQKEEYDEVCAKFKEIFSSVFYYDGYSGKPSLFVLSNRLLAEGGEHMKVVEENQLEVDTAAKVTHADNHLETMLDFLKL